MKIIFKDNISVYNRPDLEKSFANKYQLNTLLKEYGNWKYAYFADVYDDNNNLIMNLALSDNGGWALNTANMDVSE